MVQGANQVNLQTPSFTIGGNQYVTRSYGQGGIEPLSPMAKPNFEQYDCYNSPVTLGVSGDKFDSNRWIANFGY